MDSDTLVNFLLVLFLVLLGGVFAGTEMALVSLREIQVRRSEKMGRGGKNRSLGRESQPISFNGADRHDLAGGLPLSGAG